MKMKFTLLLLMFAVLATALLGGCTVSNGVFMGMSQQSGDTSISASYVSFDGSLARSVPLEAGDAVSFSYEGGEGLRAFVKQNGQELGGITDGGTFSASADGQYAFVVEGEAENGAFSLSWQIE
jgi:hypothetical protein